jgi:hypothetical protein
MTNIAGVTTVRPRLSGVEALAAANASFREFGA